MTKRIFLAKQLDDALNRISQLEVENRNLLDALIDIVYQFAHQGTSQGQPALYTGGLSALETAFWTLKWDEPHLVDDTYACEIEGCHEWPNSGMKWDEVYLHLCSAHVAMHEQGTVRPDVKAHAVEREKRRGLDGVLRP